MLAFNDNIEIIRLAPLCVEASFCFCHCASRLSCGYAILRSFYSVEHRGKNGGIEVNESTPYGAEATLMLKYRDANIVF